MSIKTSRLKAFKGQIISYSKRANAIATALFFMKSFPTRPVNDKCGQSAVKSSNGTRQMAPQCGISGYAVYSHSIVAGGLEVIS